MTRNLQVQDLLDAFRSELDARVLATRSRSTVREALDAADRMERAVASLVESGHDVDPDPLARWTAELREILQPAAREDTSTLASLLVKVRAIQALPELISSEQLAEARELQERGERQRHPEPRRRRSRAAWSTRLHGIDPRHLPFGVRVECDPCRETVAGVRDRGASDWSTVQQRAKQHNARRHADAWPVLRTSLNDALQALLDGDQVRVDPYVLHKR